MKLVKQISIFVENKPGALADALAAIGEKGIDISALSIADTKDFGILRLIVNEPDAAVEAVKEIGMIVKTADVIAIAVDDVPGGLAGALKKLKEYDVFIEYMYAFIGKGPESAMVIIRAEDPDAAVAALAKTDIKVFDAEEIYAL